MSGLSGAFCYFFSLSVSYCGNEIACLPVTILKNATFPLTVFKSNKSLGTMYTCSLVYYRLSLTGDDEIISTCFHLAEGKCLPAAAPFEISFL